MPLLLNKQFTHALPKTELHAHLSGSISKETLHAIWRQKQSQPECRALEDPLTAIRSGTDGFVDIHTFFPLFDTYIYALCNDVESVRFATASVLADFEADGVRYLELRTTPREFAATGMTRAGYVQTIDDALLGWNAGNGEKMEVYLILSIDRRMTPQQAMDVVDFAIQHHVGRGGSVVGVDLCGNPAKGDATTFTPAFQKAKANRLGITVHFAEDLRSSSPRELETILSWQPDRLGHCVHVPPAVADVIEARGIGVELCLSCNVLGRLTTGGFGQHHLGAWLQRAAPIALSTDDVGVFGSPLSEEYRMAAETFLDSQTQVVRLCRSAVNVAFAGRERMTRLVDEFEREYLQETANQPA
ncbi:hypothetical protein BDY17DRAFT_309446 [Neohortaea acidophila]|uniref:Adenosine deaminase domain-containing protein n=1 Tax=Neohortaea acidophila TaxID=245834 RepID=A0A6A6PVI2_9PEZI|nr:uncharacterized protein BDY17DRAFT_309446 [Neohortaea acidophila]KAF2484140.1 hypothetical protein BDY17DRAFT_309446 [Neohortaea acidophila]